MRLPPRPRFVCPICQDAGVVTARDGSLDACGRCAKWAEAEWRAARKDESRAQPKPAHG